MTMFQAGSKSNVIPGKAEITFDCRLIPEEKPKDIAKEIGLDGRDFRACFESREGVSRILASKQYGVELGVTGTPTIFVNGQPVPRTNQFYSYPGLEAFIKQQAAAAADNAAE